MNRSSAVFIICSIFTSIGAEDALVSGLRAEAQAIAAVRDGLVQRLDQAAAAAATGEPARTLVLKVPAAIAAKGAADKSRQPLEITIQRRNGAWLAGTATGYNKSRHPVAAVDLKLDATTLRGTVRVTLRSDGWLPPDLSTRTLDLALDLGLAATAVDGSVQVSGDFGSYESKANGQLTPIPAPRRAADQISPLPKATGEPAEAEALVAWATAAYQEIRAATISLGHPEAAFEQALLGTRLSAPGWDLAKPANRPLALAYVQELRALVTAPAAPADAIILDTLTYDDPGFGLRFGAGPMPEQDGIAVLPEDASSAAPGQDWRFVTHWQRLAVFPGDPVRQFDTPTLPDVVFAPGAAYKPDQARLGAGYKMPADGTFGWTGIASNIFQIPPPGQPFFPQTSQGHHGVTKGDYGIHGVMRGRWYGAATIRAVKDVELHAAVLADDYGKLWLNQRQVWASQATIMPAALIRLALKKGDNRVILACENEQKNSAFGLALCVKGGPLAPAAREALIKRTAEATLALPPLAVKGRFGDWTSRFPDANPPLAWDLKRKINVRWHTPLPDWSCANPVISGDQVYVLGEPHVLYCLDKDTGAIRWQRESHVFEFVPETERVAAMRAWMDAATVQDSPEVKAWNEQISVGTARLTDEKAQPPLSPEERRDFTAQVDTAKKERDAFVRAKTGLAGTWKSKLGVQDAGWYNVYGNSWGAPVADQDHVWVKFGTGVAACYDRNGKRLWMVRTGLSGGPGNIASPVLLGGTLVIQGQGSAVGGDASKWKAISAQFPPFCAHAMIGLDPLTGATRWIRPVMNTGAYGGGTGIVPLRLSNGTDTRELVLTGDSTVVDPKDGSMLTDCRGLGVGTWAGDPVMRGNRAFFHRGGKVEVLEFWLEASGSVGARRLPNLEGGDGYAGSVWHRDRLWGNNPRGSAPKQPVPFHELTISDARTGQRIPTIYPALRDGGLGYAAPAAAGDYVVITGNGTGPFGWSIDPTASAEIGFAKCDAEPWMATTCRIDGESMTATPVFEGGRMFLRTYRSAICIEITTEEGRLYALKAMAQHRYNEIPRKPEDISNRTVIPPSTWTPGEGVPVELVDRFTAPHGWLMAGPFATTAPDADTLGALGGPTKARPQVNAPFAYKDGEYRFVPLAAGHFTAFKGEELDMFKLPRYTARCKLDVLGASGSKANTTTWFLSAIDNKTDHWVRVDATRMKGVSIWLGGQPVADGDRVQLAAGIHPVLIQSVIGKIPPFLKDRKIEANIRFTDIPDPAGELKAWRAKVRAQQPLLQKIVDQLPACPERLQLNELIRAAQE